LIALYLLIVDGGAAFAWTADVGWWTGIRQVMWELVDGVPVLKLTEGWDRPVGSGDAVLPQIVLIGIRAGGLLVVLPVLIRVWPHLVQSEPSAAAEPAKGPVKVEL
jgi:hypothetical protein